MAWSSFAQDFWRSSKPIRGSVLELAHPLSRGMLGCWPFTEYNTDNIFDYASRELSDLPVVQQIDWSADFAQFYSDLYGIPTNNILNPISESITVIFSGMCYNEAVKRCAVSKGNNTFDANMYYYFGVDELERPYVYIRNGAGVGESLELNATSGLSPFYVHHVAFSYNGNTGDISIYINGSLDITDNQTILTGLPEVDPQWYIGTSETFSGEYWARSIGGVWIWDRALLEGEIKQHFVNPYCMFRTPAVPAGIIVDSVAGSQTVGPGLITAIYSLPNPTLAMRIIPESVAPTFSIPVPILVSIARIEPVSLENVFSILTPILAPGASTLQPDSISLISSIQTPTSKATLHPDSLAVDSSIQAPVLLNTIYPEVVSTNFAVSTPTLLAGTVRFPEPVSAAFSTLTPVLIPGEVVKTPEPISLVSSLPTPSVGGPSSVVIRANYFRMHREAA